MNEYDMKIKNNNDKSNHINKLDLHTYLQHYFTELSKIACKN